MFDNKGKKKFNLMRPTSTNLPYYSYNRDSHLMRLLGNNGSALYEVDLTNGTFKNVNDPRYGKGYFPDDAYEDRCPDRVQDADLRDEVLKALDSDGCMLS